MFAQKVLEISQRITLLPLIKFDLFSSSRLDPEIPILPLRFGQVGRALSGVALLLLSHRAPWLLWKCPTGGRGATDTAAGRAGRGTQPLPPPTSGKYFRLQLNCVSSKRLTACEAAGIPRGFCACKCACYPSA